MCLRVTGQGDVSTTKIFHRPRREINSLALQDAVSRATSSRYLLLGHVALHSVAEVSFFRAVSVDVAVFVFFVLRPRLLSQFFLSAVVDSAVLTTSTRMKVSAGESVSGTALSASSASASR